MSDTTTDNALVFTTKAPMLALDIVIDDEPVTLKFKSINQVPADVIVDPATDKVRDNTSLMLATLRWALEEDSHKIVMGLPMPAWNSILAKMNEASDADLGKSQGSSNSSTSTGKRSKRTSSASASA